MEKNNVLDADVEVLELSVRAGNCLKIARTKTLRDLTQRTERSLLEYLNFGMKSLEEVKVRLSEIGLRLKEDTEKDNSDTKIYKTSDGNKIKHKYSKLNEQQEKVLVYRLGIYEKPKTLREIADIMLLSPERIRQIEAKSVKKMKGNHVYFKKRLKSYRFSGYGIYSLLR